MHASLYSCYKAACLSHCMVDLLADNYLTVDNYLAVDNYLTVDMAELVDMVEAVDTPRSFAIHIEVISKRIGCKMAFRKVSNMVFVRIRLDMSSILLVAYRNHVLIDYKAY